MSVYIDPMTCNGCQVCVELCPTNALKVVSGIAQVSALLCVDCEACIIRCPMQAITFD